MFSLVPVETSVGSDPKGDAGPSAEERDDTRRPSGANPLGGLLFAPKGVRERS